MPNIPSKILQFSSDSVLDKSSVQKFQFKDISPTERKKILESSAYTYVFQSLDVFFQSLLPSTKERFDALEDHFLRNFYLDKTTQEFLKDIPQNAQKEQIQEVLYQYVNDKIFFQKSMAQFSFLLKDLDVQDMADYLGLFIPHSNDKLKKLFQKAGSQKLSTKDFILVLAPRWFTEFNAEKIRKELKNKILLYFEKEVSLSCSDKIHLQEFLLEISHCAYWVMTKRNVWHGIAFMPS